MVAQLTPDTFGYLRFERHESDQNVQRYYVLAWQPTLFGAGAVVRQFGRQGQSQRLLFTEFPSLEAAWPLIAAIIHTRLRHHYHIITPLPDA